MSFDTLIDRLDWAGIAAQLDADGHALLPGLLSADAARTLARQATIAAARLQSVSAGPGCGERFQFGSELPAPLEAGRSALYRRLFAIANRWNGVLGVDARYPPELEDFRRRNRKAGQTRPLSHLTLLGAEDQVRLHQHNDGEQVFPLQIVALLSAPGEDFEGGECVLIEQRPRMQSRPSVLPLERGDAAIIATAGRPCRGTRGHWRANFRHAVGRVRTGQRVGLELLFHDAP